MLEIIVIVILSKNIAAKMKTKGRSAAGYIVLFILMWFGGEIVGAIVGTIVSVAQDPAALERGFNIMAYLFALAGAVISGGITYAFVSALPPVNRTDRDFDDYEEDFERDRGN